MTLIKLAPRLLTVVTVALVGLHVMNGHQDKTVDRGFDRKHQPQHELKAGIWIDPNGCDHWIIDDGVEGYLSATARSTFGKPVCSGSGEPNGQRGHGDRSKGQGSI